MRAASLFLAGKFRLLGPIGLLIDVEPLKPVGVLDLSFLRFYRIKIISFNRAKSSQHTYLVNFLKTVEKFFIFAIDISWVFTWDEIVVHLMVPLESSLDISAHNHFASAIRGRHATFNRSICLSDLLKVFLVAILGAMRNKIRSTAAWKICVTF